MIYRGGNVFGRRPTVSCFVVGCARSGTTFVGKVLSAGRSVGYLHEPFNPIAGLPSVRSSFVDLDHDPAVRAEFQELLALRGSLKTAMYERDALARRLAKRAVGSRGTVHLRAARLNPWLGHLVVKDPHATFLTNHVLATTNAAVVGLVRHPLATFASFVRLGATSRWQTEHLLSNPLALEHIDRDVHRQLLEGERGDELQFAALWTATANYLADLQARTPRVRVFRHEDISAEPQRIARELHDFGGLPWTPDVARKVGQWTSSENPVETRGARVQDFHRDSASLLATRLSQVDDETTDRLWPLVEASASRWYDRTGALKGVGTENAP